MTLLAIALILALGNRLRGGLWGDRIGWGTQVARFCAWGIPFGASCWWLGMPWWAAMLAGIAAWAGCTAGQFGALSMGHRGGASGWTAWENMLGWGSIRIAGPFFVMVGMMIVAGADYSPVWFALAGLATPAVYDVVWRVPPWVYLPGLGYGDGPATGYDPPELAEAIMGVVFAVGLYASIV